MSRCEVIEAGLVPYREAWAWQQRLAAERAHGAAPDLLLLLEHPHTYTLGTGGDAHNLLLTPDELHAQGIELVQSDRGGDITYHGPGQLVGYPILQLPRTGDLHADVIGYLRRLEDVIIAVLAEDGLRGFTIPGLTGVWVDTAVGPAKVCAIGVRVGARAVTQHGFALNVNTDLRRFDGIIPCGIRDKAVTSLAALLGAPQSMAQVRQRVIAHFGALFGLDMATIS